MMFKRRGGINTMFHLTHGMLKTHKQQNKKCADRNGGEEDEGLREKIVFFFVR